MVAMIVPYVALQLITIGDGMNISTKGVVPYMVAVVFSCAIICFHVFGGGMKAVAWMDTFNFILGVGTLWIMIIVLVVVNFDGGMVGVYNALKDDPISMANLGAPGATGYFNIPGVINQALTASVATIVWPHIYSRCYIAKSKKNFEVMAWGLPIGYLMVFSGLILIGAYIAPVILGSGFDQADSIVPYLATYYAPPVISAVAMLCLFAFAISTGESMLLSGTAMVTKDGSKCFITSGGLADVFTVFATVDREKGVKGITCFIVEKSREGVSVGKAEDKIHGAFPRLPEIPSATRPVAAGTAPGAPSRPAAA